MARRGRGKGKGSAFERKVCKLLSKWVSRGKRTDLFWRTAMSGGRATVERRKGVVVRQAGDICAVTPDGHAFTDHWYVECKSYKSIGLTQWIVNNDGKIPGWWAKCKREARDHGREPMLIVKQNFLPILVITRLGRSPTEPLCNVHERGAQVSRFDHMIHGEFTYEHHR